MLHKMIHWSLANRAAVLCISLLLMLMGLLLWRYLNVKVPEVPSRPLLV